MGHPQYVRADRSWRGGAGLHVVLADEMRLGCQLLLNGMQAILALAQARDLKDRPGKGHSIRFGGGNRKPLSLECLSGEGSITRTGPK